MSVVTKLAYEIPQLRNWLEAILYSLFPIVLVLLIPEQGRQYARNTWAYFSSLLALGLIHFLCSNQPYFHST